MGTVVVLKNIITKSNKSNHQHINIVNTTTTTPTTTPPQKKKGKKNQTKNPKSRAKGNVRFDTKAEAQNTD